MHTSKEIISILYESSIKFSSSRSISDLYTYLVTILRKNLDTDLISVWIVNKPQMVITCVSADGFGKERFEKKNVKIGTGVLGRLVQNRREIWITAENDPENLLLSFTREWEIKSNFLGSIPLITQEELFGIVLVSHLTHYEEDKQTKNLNFFRRLVYSSALAMEGISNREKLAKRIRDLTTLSDIGTKLSASLDLEKILNTMLYNMIGHFIVEHVVILLSDEKTNRLIPIEYHGFTENIRDIDFSFESELFNALCQIKTPIFTSELHDSSLSLEEQKRLEKLKAFLLVPIFVQDDLLGLITLGEKLTQEPYNENELEFLSTVASQSGIAIKNALLFEAEKKAKELSILLEISKEITATLDLDRVLKAFVNLSSQVIEYDRATVGLFQRDNLRITAISGLEKVDRKTKDIPHLERLLAWVVSKKQPVYVTSLEEEIQAENEETKERLKEYFKTNQMRSFLAMPLTDEEGVLGIVSMESQSSNFLTERSLEVVEILSNQLTVAIRNAELYQQIPLVKVIQPIFDKKRALLRLPKRKVSVVAIFLAMIISFLIFWKSELKITSPAEIWPECTYTITTEVEGIIQKILVREGDIVQPNQLLATLYNERIDSKLNEVQAQLKTSQGVARYFFAANRINQYQIERNQIEKLETELSLLKKLNNSTKIISPISGTILTPRLEEKVGEFLVKGDTICQVADMNQIRAEIQFSGNDILLVKENQRVKLLVNAFPQMTFWGRVDKVPSSANSEMNDKIFLVLAKVDNAKGLLHPGMTAHAKVYCGEKSLAYNIFRKPVRLFRELAWRILGV